MISIAFATFAVFSYLASTVLIVRHIHQNALPRPAVYLAWAAVGGHAAVIAAKLSQHPSFSFNFFSTASLVAMVVALLLLIAALNKPVEKLGVVLFPIAAAMLGMDIYFADTSQHLSHHSGAMTAHILSSILAFSLLNIAALQALLLHVQDMQLKSHPPKRFIQSLPSLQAMESLLFQMISAGLLFLTFSLVTGFAFIEDLFAQHLVHKTVLSILAWLIFSSLLIGRQRYGWRGKTAIQWTVCGFVLLLLAYFGSAMVLELILHR